MSGHLPGMKKLNIKYQYTDQIPFQNETGTVLTSSSSFDLLVLIEPSYWDFHPNNPTYEYKINDWFEGYLDVFNVAPKPLVEWTMNNASIEGLTIRDVNGMQSFDGHKKVFDLLN